MRHMPETAVLLWPLAALLSAVGLYLGPAVCTVLLLALPVAYVATIWSH